MAGRNKAFIRIGEKTILDRIMASIVPIFSEILLVTRQPELYKGYQLKVVEDIFESRSSLTGIHAGLVHAASAYAFVVPCDAPFISPGLVRYLIDQAEDSLDAVIPVSGDHYEPLCAIYSKRCIPFIEDQLQRKDFKIINMFDKINLRTIPVEDFRTIDPDLSTFFNVNTPEAHKLSQAKARQLAVQSSGQKKV